MAHPSERVHDEFRSRSIGKGGTAPFNSKAATDDFHVDRSRLGHHDEWDPDAKNDWGGTGKTVQKPNSIMDAARGSMGGLGARSVYKPLGSDEKNNDAPCCYEPRPRNNPLMRRKGD